MIIFLLCVFQSTWILPGNDFKVSASTLSLNGNIKESTTSKLGKINATGSKIYYNLNNLKSFFITTNTHINKVYYIKKLAKLNNQIYYLLSTQPSSEKGVVGWVHANDVTVRDHVGVDNKSKTLYVRGTGHAYSKAWGDSKDIVFEDLSIYRNTIFKVNKTEKVGNNIWYRGLLNGKTVFLHSNWVMESKEEKTSKLGHLKNENVKIYNRYHTTSITAGATLTNAVYYIKSQIDYKGTRYYLISTQPSSENGVIGWVSANDLSIRDHVGVDTQSKTLYIKGYGLAYSKAWGGKKDIVFEDLKSYKNHIFKVNKTEKVGNNIWYRGVLDGKTVFLHANWVGVKEESVTSKLGHLKNESVQIFKTIGDYSSAFTAKGLTNAVYYIKKQASVNGETYYLLSSQPSSEKGLIGWVHSGNVDTRTHVGVDTIPKTFYVKGTGKAYSKAWGGEKDIVFEDLSKYKNNVFIVNKTEKVGNNIWYRGILNGRTVFLHSNWVSGDFVTYIHYGVTLNEALNIQMQKNPQTDKYKNSPAYVYSKDVDINTGGKITGSSVNLRTSPKLTAGIYKTVNAGTLFILLDSNITGDAYNNDKKWYKIEYDNKILYVHSSLAKINIKVGKVNKNNVNIYSSSNTNSHIYGTEKNGKLLEIVEVGTNWHKITYNTWRNATPSDVKYYLDPTNFQNDPIQKFQFLDLTKPSGATASQLNMYLKGKGVLENKGEKFIEAANKYGINDIYLISHALLETGNGTSELAKGVKYNGVTVYNVYGIGAYDGNPIENGAKTAYERGWTTIDKAIVEGAAFIGNNYIKTGQNTLYKMRWNPASMEKGIADHQYATDIGWAYKQVITLYNLYQQIGINSTILEIPVYKN